MMLKRSAMRLLLVLPFVVAGLNGGALALELSFPCGDSVCYHIWTFTPRTASVDVALVSNAEMKATAAGVNDRDARCTERLRPRTQKTRELHYCKFPGEAFVAQNDVPEVKATPGDVVSFQCILVSYLTLGHCFVADRLEVFLLWVDRAGAVVQDTSGHRIRRKSPCDVRLTVTLQAPGREAFRCRARVGAITWTSVDMRVQVPAPKGKGRGGFTLEGVEPQGNSRFQVGVVVAVLACAALTALAAMFVVVRRRKASNLAEAPCPIANSNQVPDDVVYADVVLPDAPETVSFSHAEDTEYACVRYQ
ncbi:uncharacterized protein LOC133496457 isoform X2 [Syngnathoides biaculeatus]|uniref:uncharacterized protein LOC133496457 isoform X2 n=1 Tax=Syngnathoides biaculeatus TaxID=300417 RepID=UPI002ADD9EF8|nr:uncharacterized protein LOC133496457 isoform X2 [Syngnathoides biaculeatus]